jgi:hypothetical protein
MKISGATIPKPQVEVVVFTRGEQRIVFKAAPVTDFTDFEKLCPMPAPPIMLKKGGIKVQDVEDKDYKAAVERWATLRTDWMMLKSLQATDNLQWDTVDMSNCDTWSNYRTELETCLSQIEMGAIVRIVVDACGLNQKKIDDATKDFLAGQVETPTTP